MYFVLFFNNDYKPKIYIIYKNIFLIHDIVIKIDKLNINEEKFLNLILLLIKIYF